MICIPAIVLAQALNIGDDLPTRGTGEGRYGKGGSREGVQASSCDLVPDEVDSRQRLGQASQGHHVRVLGEDPHRREHVGGRQRHGNGRGRQECGLPLNSPHLGLDCEVARRHLPPCQGLRRLASGH